MRQFHRGGNALNTGPARFFAVISANAQVSAAEAICVAPAFAVLAGRPFFIQAFIVIPVSVVFLWRRRDMQRVASVTQISRRVVWRRLESGKERSVHINSS